MHIVLSAFILRALLALLAQTSASTLILYGVGSKRKMLIQFSVTFILLLSWLIRWTLSQFQ